ncbi:MAG: 1-acyl-sn-glycerol-3-phosphate acyltransferase [Halieaceae bacterium]|jgi:1-acyl-sn-glycerol-3-phosphate acyltransferase
MYKRTIFNTPLLTPLLRLLVIPLYAVFGWKVKGRPGDARQMVMIAAPHTSNWDFILMLMVVFILRLDLYWMGKMSLFPWPVSGLMKYLGGIPVDRSASNNVVEQMIAMYAKGQPLVLLNTPEGTRGKVRAWKTGYYHIAAGAGVPVQPAYVNAPDKVVGFLDPFITGADAEADLAEIQGLYRSFEGIRPELS